MRIMTGLRIVYHLARLSSSFILLLPSFKWKNWRAKAVFRKELIRNGIPLDLAHELTVSYDSATKNLRRLVLAGHSSNEKDK